MKFYMITDSNYFNENGRRAYGTIKEAAGAAQEIADEMEYEVQVDHVEMDMKREKIIGLMNRSGWKKHSKVVFTAKPARLRTDGARQRKEND